MTQKQFASFLNVKFDTLQSWELGRNAIPQSKAIHILMMTGAWISDRAVTDSSGNDYSTESWEKWKRMCGEHNRFLLQKTAHLKGLFEILMVAASKKNHVLQAYLQMIEAMNTVIEELELAEEIKISTRKIKHEGLEKMPVSVFRQNKKFARAVGFRDCPAFGDDDVVTYKQVKCVRWPRPGQLSDVIHYDVIKSEVLSVKPPSEAE